MLIILPLIAFVLLWLIFQTRGNYWRNSVLLAAPVWGLFLSLITEILSNLKLLTVGGVVGLWLLTNLILGFIYWQLRQEKQPVVPEEKYPIPTFLMLLLSGIGFIVAAVGLLAILASPNNWDSMTYHMVRVVHWIQNRSLEHFPSNYLPQLYLMPWSGYAIAHFQILAGSDRFVNLVQWFSMVGSVIGISLIAKQLGADIRGQVFAAVFCATIPMGILQSSSTQSDYVVTFWLVCLIYFVLEALKTGITIKQAIFIGLSLGLATLTKGTAYIFAFPFMVWLLVGSLKQVYWKKLWKPFLIIAFLALFLNLGYYSRNIDLFGSPLGSTQGFQGTDDPQGFKYTNDAFSVPILVSNVVRNLAIHADIVRNLGLQGVITPTTGVTEKVVKIIHQALGVDINDDRTTRQGPFHVPALSTNEDTAGNPLHFFIILSLLLFLAIRWKHFRKEGLLIIYPLAIITAFLLFCYQLKWQPYHARLHVSLFVPFAAFVGVLLSQLPKKLANIVPILLLVTSLHWVFNNQFRPFTGAVNVFNQTRIEQYFTARKYLQEPYTKAVNFVNEKGCANVGLMLEDHWEYPWWVLFQQNKNSNVKFEHVNVPNISNRTANEPPHKDFIPCAIIHKLYNSGTKTPPSAEMKVKERVYTRAFFANTVNVYLRKQDIQ